MEQGMGGYGNPGMNPQMGGGEMGGYSGGGGMPPGQMGPGANVSPQMGQMGGGYGGDHHIPALIPLSSVSPHVSPVIRGPEVMSLLLNVVDTSPDLASVPD